MKIIKQPFHFTGYGPFEYLIFPFKDKVDTRFISIRKIIWGKKYTTTIQFNRQLINFSVRMKEFRTFMKAMKKAQELARKL